MSSASSFIPTAPRLRRVIESLKARHAIGYGPKGQANGAVGPAWREGRREIADYLTALHTPLEGGSTPFAAIWKALRARSREQLQLSRFGDVHLPDELLRDEAAQALLQSDLSLYSEMLLQYRQRFRHADVVTLVDNQVQ